MTNEELCVRAKAGDAQACKELILQNQRFVWDRAWAYMRLYESWCIDAEDIMHAGCLGLLRAVEKYDPEHGEQFITYAYYCVTKYVKRYCDETARERQNAELSENDGDDDPEESDPEQPVVSGNYPNRKIESDLIRDESNLLLYRALTKLTPRQKEYVFYRFGFDEENRERTVSEAAEYFRLRVTRAKRLEGEALESLRRYIVRDDSKQPLPENPDTPKMLIGW